MLENIRIIPSTTVQKYTEKMRDFIKLGFSDVKEKQTISFPFLMRD